MTIDSKHTSIIISKDTWKRLNKMRECGVSFEYIILSLLEKYEKYNINNVELIENKKL